MSTIIPENAGSAPGPLQFHGWNRPDTPADFPRGSTWHDPRTGITYRWTGSAWENTADLAAAVTGILPSTNGGTGNGFTKFTGPATSEKTFTLPNASATVLTDNDVITPAQGGTGVDNGAFELTIPATGTAVLTGTEKVNYTGYAASAELTIFDTTINVNGADVIEIGSDVYEFVDTEGSVSLDTNIAVEIGADAEETLDNFIAAINNTATAAHPNITLLDLVTPALGRGTESVVATIEYASAGNVAYLTVQKAAAPGGAVVLGTSALPVLVTIGSWGGWSSETFVGGRAAETQKRVSRTSFTTDAAMVANALITLKAPFAIYTVTAINRTTGTSFQAIFDANSNRVQLGIPAAGVGDIIDVIMWE